MKLHIIGRYKDIIIEDVKDFDFNSGFLKITFTHSDILTKYISLNSINEILVEE